VHAIEITHGDNTVFLKRALAFKVAHIVKKLHCPLRLLMCLNYQDF
jgi:hypothetical protein